MVTEEQAVSGQKLIESLNYYTPSIEDIHVGYECQVLLTGDNPTGPTVKAWVKGVVNRFGCRLVDTVSQHVYPTDVFYNMVEGGKYVRTPYLTKKQIEAEGWVEDTDHPIYKGLLRMKNDKATYWVRMDKTNLFIMRYTKPDPNNVWEMQQRSIVYDGNCPSINEFRTICKLLSI